MPARKPRMPKRPNVLVFVSHDTGRCIAPYGYSTFHTPACDRLAAEGLRCAQAFCTSPLCSPARGSLFTGRYPHQNGVDGLVGRHRGFAFHAGERHAARVFGDAGYESVLCGMVHESDNCQSLGFEGFLAGPGEQHNDGGDLLTFGEHIASWLSTRDAQRPFYLQIGCSDTHRQWTKRAQPDRSLGIWQPPYLTATEEVQEEVAEFQGGVRRLDEGIGRILQALDEAAVADETLCVFTTDHGADFPNAKGTLRDPGIEVFLLLRYPPWGAGRVLDPLISHVDILPTLLAACGIPDEAQIAGRSFLPLLTGAGDDQAREAIYACKTYQDQYDPRRAIRTTRWKYQRYFSLQPYSDLRKATIERQHQIAYAGSTFGHPEELYDLSLDPQERQNLAEDPEHRDTLEDLRRRLALWMRSTNDPLLDGPVECPAYRRYREEFLGYAQEDEPAITREGTAP